MKTALNIKTDKDIKQKAQKIAGELGLPLSSIINAYLRQFVREEEIYFSIASTMTHQLEVIIEEAEKDLAQNKNISPAFSSAKELDRYLAAS
jgi:DNA-damage-inducible protein J